MSFITRLEKEAYGREPLALLYAQLQDSLRYELVQVPAYEQLCIAAKGEERRLMALKKARAREWQDPTCI